MHNLTYQIISETEHNFNVLFFYEYRDLPRSEQLAKYITYDWVSKFYFVNDRITDLPTASEFSSNQLV